MKPIFRIITQFCPILFCITVVFVVGFDDPVVILPIFGVLGGLPLCLRALRALYPKYSKKKGGYELDN